MLTWCQISEEAERRERICPEAARSTRSPGGRRSSPPASSCISSGIFTTETKEEIFLALLHREYLAWASDLETLGETASGGAEALAEGLACTLDRRETMLRLVSTSLFEMEAHSRVEALAEFKRACKTLMAALDGCVAAFCPEKDEAARERFAFAFLPFVYGVYPYSTVTEKQRMAMDQAEMRYDPPAQHEMVRCGAAMLLGKH